MKSTQAMRDRIRELMTEPMDDYDRAVWCVVDDLEMALKALSGRAFSMSEPHLSGYRLILGFSTREEVSAAQQYIAALPHLPQANAEASDE